ncbi:anhydro-N-acetylmuramic acid kinase [Sciscionella marina]|uniref:anhydro-N-acetylmuramic acid kinase n=1 Tax=Sciscionella marina TaxID=508770 RepID=UPI0004765578|nr:anhydro-N-acetylmuramic acid kinase [Sciscionella marina]
MRVLGMQSGTSMDGVDAAVLEIEPVAEGIELRLGASRTVPYPDWLRAELGSAVAGAALDARTLCLLDTELGKVFGSIAAEFDRVDLVASMGQTLYHLVEDGKTRGTLQLGQPAWIAERAGVPVVADFRPRDVAAGGQGAPLVPVLDELLLRGFGGSVPMACVNIGGIANITVVAPGGPTFGYDTGPGNALLDIAWEQGGDQGSPYDVDAALARTGAVHEPMLRALLEDPYYARRPPKSTGKEYFDARMIGPYRELPLADLLATLTELTAIPIARACAEHRVAEVLLSGGGAANPLLCARIGEHLRGKTVVRTSAEAGLPVDAKEAVLAGLLGWLTWHGVAGNVPSATGADAPRVLGSITPAGTGARLGEPRPGPPEWLRVVATSEGEGTGR